MKKLIPERPGVVILGAGGHASVVADVLRQLDFELEAACDTNSQTEFSERLQLPVIQDEASLLGREPGSVWFANGIGSVGDTGLRAQVFNAFRSVGHDFPVLCHPSATLSPTVSLGTGCQVMAGAVIQANARLGDNALVNTAASIDHDCDIGNHCHIASGAVLCGHVSLRRNVHVGSGVRILQDVTIGERAMLGMGTIILADVPAGRKVHPVRDGLVWTGE